MQHTEIDIPIYFTGSMRDSIGGDLPNSFWGLYYVPNVGGSAITESGTYNVPLLLRLHD